MPDRTRTKIAALATALFIGGLSVAGIGLRHQTVAPSTGSATDAAQASSTATSVAPASEVDEGSEGDVE